MESLSALQKRPSGPLGGSFHSKYEIINHITKIRKLIGLGHGAINFLRACISLDIDEENNHVIFAKNATLAERAGGMSIRSVQYNLSKFIRSGLMVRKSSSNGKRYVDYHDGQIYGLDLSPLFSKAKFFADLATEEDMKQKSVKRIKVAQRNIKDIFSGESSEKIAPLKEKYYSLIERLNFDGNTRELLLLSEEFEALLEIIHEDLYKIPSLEKKMDNPDEKSISCMLPCKFCMHIEYINNNYSDSAFDFSKTKNENISHSDLVLPFDSKPEVKLNTPIKSVWSPEDQRGLPGILGIGSKLWSEAVFAFNGPENARVVIDSIQMKEGILKPGGYLKHLIRQAELGNFSIEDAKKQILLSQEQKQARKREEVENLKRMAQDSDILLKLKETDLNLFNSWVGCLTYLKKSLGEDIFESWFSPRILMPIAYDLEVGVLKIKTKSKFIKSWIESYYDTKLNCACKKFFPNLANVELLY